ncbi:MAG: hypothetical protein K2X82_31270 [Gemmataceae bacterium]|nr:hypothetical protein [Gemmataceae bacterium]
MFAKLTRLLTAPAEPAPKPKLGMDRLEARDCPAYFGFSQYMLNPQPLPPRESYSFGGYGHVMLNPQPLPPRFSYFSFG